MPASAVFLIPGPSLSAPLLVLEASVVVLEELDVSPEPTVSDLLTTPDPLRSMVLFALAEVVELPDTFVSDPVERKPGVRKHWLTNCDLT